MANVFAWMRRSSVASSTHINAYAYGVMIIVISVVVASGVAMAMLMIRAKNVWFFDDGFDSRPQAQSLHPQEVYSQDICADHVISHWAMQGRIESNKLKGVYLTHLSLQQALKPYDACPGCNTWRPHRETRALARVRNPYARFVGLNVQKDGWLELRQAAEELDDQMSFMHVADASQPRTLPWPQLPHDAASFARKFAKITGAPINASHPRVRVAILGPYGRWESPRWLAQWLDGYGLELMTFGGIEDAMIHPPDWVWVEVPMWHLGIMGASADGFEHTQINNNGYVESVERAYDSAYSVPKHVKTWLDGIKRVSYIDSRWLMCPYPGVLKMEAWLWEQV